MNATTTVEATTAQTTPAPGFWERLGYVISAPRWALAVAGDRRHQGRGSSDLMNVVMLLVAASRTAGVVGAVWIGVAGGLMSGVRAVAALFSGVVMMSLAALLIISAVLFVLGRKVSSLNRAFDLASIAVVPLMFVQLGIGISELTLGVDVPHRVVRGLSLGGYVWAGILAALAVPVVRQAVSVPARAPRPVALRGRWAGYAILAIMVGSAGLQLFEVARHPAKVRPMQAGDPAPLFQAAVVDEAGALSGRFGSPEIGGKVTVLDFWATWCGPCKRALPDVAALAKTYGAEVNVIAINLDDPVKARALFREQGYPMNLLYDNAGAAAQFGVSTIPHVVVLDASGHVRAVYRGHTGDMADDVKTLLPRRAP